MKKKMKKMLAVLCIVGSALGLMGCGQEFDASAYMQAELDLITKHDVDQYVELMGVSQSEAEAIYEEGLAEMNSAMSELEAAGLPEDLCDDYEEWFIDLFGQTKYTVLEETKSGDEYLVEVEVEPVKAFANAPELLNEQLTVYMEDMMSEMLNGGETPTEEEINYDVYVMLLDIVTANLDNPTYGEKQVIEVTIAKNSDGLYAPDEADMTELGANMIDISDLAEIQ